MRLERCALAALAVTGAACDGQIFVGADPGGGSPVDGGVSGVPQMVVPWQTGFESGGLSEWFDGHGSCYYLGGPTGGAVFPQATAGPPAPYMGHYSGLFQVNTDLSAVGASRCVRQGAFPASAFYSAWYYVPATTKNNNGNWNLLHFDGTDVDGGSAPGLWDVSLRNQADGGLETYVLNFLGKDQIIPGAAIPIGRWFQLQVHLVADVDAGQFTLFQDQQPVPVVDISGVPTNNSSPIGEWHVGNLATSLTPGLSKVYIDNVAIGYTLNP